MRKRIRSRRRRSRSGIGLRAEEQWLCIAHDFLCPIFGTFTSRKLPSKMLPNYGTVMRKHRRRAVALRMLYAGALLRHGCRTH